MKEMQTHVNKLDKNWQKIEKLTGKYFPGYKNEKRNGIVINLTRFEIL